MTTVSGQHVSDYMHRQLEVVPQDTSVVTVATQMRTRSVGSVLIECFDRPHNDCRIAGTSMADIMSSPLITIAPTRPMVDASHLMQSKNVRHLVVTEGTDVLGIISIRDLVRHFVDADGGPVQALTNVYRPLSVLMKTAIETIGSDETALEAAQRMADKHIGALFVMEAEELVGIITEGDLVRKLLAYQLDPLTLRVGALMNSPLVDIDINRTIRDASERMSAKRIRHLAVTDHEKVVGVLSIRDLVKMVAVRDRPDFLKRESTT